MGWGNIGLSWTRYAKSTPTRHCQRCHLDYVEAANNCPHCGHMEEHELQQFLRELKTKKKKSTSLFVMVIAALLLYVIVVLFVLPVFLE
jgi:cytochrome c553